MPTRPRQLLDQYGKPLVRRPPSIRATYDGAAQGSKGLSEYWNSADYLSPNAANSFAVRKLLRSRARYEISESNPYLRGIALTLVNDFVGSGPKLQITDPRLSPDRRRYIERQHAVWMLRCKYRQKLWNLRMAKLRDGEGFKLAHTNRRLNHPIKLDFEVLECDRVTTEGVGIPLSPRYADGVRFDPHGNPEAYYLLSQHPGDTFNPEPLTGTWISSRFLNHWFRQDRGWHRGIPEVTPSLPLCALLRRYTLAVVKAAETAADFAAVLQSEGPAAQTAWTDGAGNLLQDDPFDQFPIEQGMFVTLPWGYKLAQLKAEQPTQTYREFVDSLLREIARPLLVPFNLAAGSSQDASMSSAVVDAHIYKESIRLERLHCEESVLDPDLDLWWLEAARLTGYLDDPLADPEDGDFFQEMSSLRDTPPEHTWRWDRVGLDHTDPLKVAQAMKELHAAGFLTDRDVQESYYNRDVDDWREEIVEQTGFRQTLGPLLPAPAKAEAESEDSPADDAEDATE